MATATDVGFILLTYKGKILLMLHETIPTILGQDIWHFIEQVKEENKSFEETMCNEVERQTCIKLTGVEFLSSARYNNQKKYFYHAELTDTNVNNIKRRERQLLQFYSLHELEKLHLAISTRQLVSRHKNLLEKTPHN